MTAERRTDDRAGNPPPALTAAVLALIALALAIVAVVMIGATSARAFASYTQVEATVVDEHTEQALVADRRGNVVETFRVVSIELADSTRADLRSDDLAVGETTTVYRNDSGDVFETPPGAPGFLEWALCAAVAAAAVTLAVTSVRMLLRLRRRASSSVSPA